MIRNARSLAIVAAVSVVACAQQPKGGFTGTEFMTPAAGSGSTSGSSDDGGPGPVGITPVPTPGDATIGIITTTTSDDGGGDADAQTEAAAGLSYCVTTRTCTTCDELTVAGDTTAADGSHVYIETMPDDGSAPPTTTSIAPFMTGTAATTGGPCILEPPNGSLFPNN